MHIVCHQLTMQAIWPACSLEPIHRMYQSFNSVFLSQQINEQYIRSCRFSQMNRLEIKSIQLNAHYFFARIISTSALFAWLC